eukprot:7399100-Alexandrium_andersonii.AAC.1
MQVLRPRSAAKRASSRWDIPARTACASQRGSRKVPCWFLAPFLGSVSSQAGPCAGLSRSSWKTCHDSAGSALRSPRLSISFSCSLSLCRRSAASERLRPAQGKRFPLYERYCAWTSGGRGWSAAAGPAEE